MRLFALLITIFFVSGSGFASPQDPPLRIAHLTGNFYIYTTYNTYQGTSYMANGMYLVTNQGVVMFDTPWDTTQFQPLLDSIEVRHHQKVTMAIATHWHSDKTAGLEYYRSLGIKTYTTIRTDELSKLHGKKRAEFLLGSDTTFHAGDQSFETYFPGEGHTTDNIVIWFGKERILYAGCLVKGTDAHSLGNLDDANTAEYANTLRRLKKKYPRPSYIVVTHSEGSDTHSLKHSIRLAKKL